MNDSEDCCGDQEERSSDIIFHVLFDILGIYCHYADIKIKIKISSLKTRGPTPHKTRREPTLTRILMGWGSSGCTSACSIFVPLACFSVPDVASLSYWPVQAVENPFARGKGLGVSNCRRSSNARNSRNSYSFKLENFLHSWIHSCCYLPSSVPFPLTQDHTQ